MNLEQKKEILIKMNRAINSCPKCRLCKSRTNAVPGEGNINAKIIFIGEAPGRDEDKAGRPFVGRSGKLLDELLAKIRLSRRDVWIGNVLKCRPPENRDPLNDEILACRPYLYKQIDLIKPKIVVTVGKYAMEYFLPKQKISEAHGKPFKLKNLIIYPIYHPAAALRNGKVKEILTRDFRNIVNVLEQNKETIETAKHLIVEKDNEIKSLF